MKLKLLRFIAAYIDLMIVALFQFPLYIILGGEEMNRYLYPVIAGLSVLYVFKDVFGRSIGKRIFGLAVVTDDGKKAVWWKRILRNALTVIYPVDILLILIRKDGKKMLDLPLHTDVVIEKAGMYTSSGTDGQH